jgi:hypothetical protein
MKYNYWFWLLVLLFLAFNFYLVKKVNYVANNLTEVKGTLIRMSAYGAQGPEKVTVQLKEYPGIKFLKYNYGEIEKTAYNRIETIGKMDTPYIHVGHLPDADLQVSLYIFKDQKLAVGNNVQYFYLRKSDQKYSATRYFFEVLFYSINLDSLFITGANVLGVILFFLAFRFELMGSTNHYALTPKTKWLLVLMLYGFIISSL